MEELMELIKLPFEILGAASSEGAVGYGILMILVGVAIVMMAYYVLEFMQNIFKMILRFFGDGINSFTTMFKRSPAKATPCAFAERQGELIRVLGLIEEKLNKKESIF